MTRLQKDLASLPDEPLTEAQQMDRRLASNFLEIQQWEFQSTHFHRGNPSFYVGEAIFGVISLFRRDFAPFDQRLEAAIQRMNAVVTLLQQARENIHAAPVGLDRTRHHRVRRLPLLPRIRPPSPPPRQQRRVQTEAESAAASAAEAFRRFKHWLESELAPNDAYASGPDAFDMMLRKGHCLNMNASRSRSLRLGPASRK